LPKGDVVYKFTPPATAKYNFRVISRPNIAAVDVAIVLVKDCPSIGTQMWVNYYQNTYKKINMFLQFSGYPNCYDAVNRRLDFVELFDCQELTAGLTAYIVVDLVNSDVNSLTNTSVQYFLEISSCNSPPDEGSTPATAPFISCGITGGIDQLVSDTADFYQLPQLEQNALIFALVDGAAASVGGFKLALTTADGVEVQTFAADNDPLWGSNSSSIVGE